MKGLWVFILLILAISCKKDEELNRIPVIEFQSISESQVVQFENAVEVTFRYSDEDGDIGEMDPDALSLRVKDARLEAYDWYHIPPVTPNMLELDVEGSVSVSLNPLFLLGNGSQEQTSFTLQLKDRAGNWSNQIVSPEVLITDSL